MITTSPITSRKTAPIIFTVCNIAYLPKALVLAQSVKKHTNSNLKVVIFDRKTDFKHPNDIAEIIWVEDCNVPQLSELAMLYDIIEFSTSLKPYLALRFLEQAESVVFLDPDTCLYSSIESIEGDLKNYPIVLTPHYLKPQPSTHNESDLAMMRFGSFNLGFFAVRKSDEGLAFLQWWSERCIAFSFMESQFGLSTDQKWVSIAPCFFPNLHVSFNPGYNMAPWNTFERSLSKNESGVYLVNGSEPLVFFHFSNFDAQDLEYTKKRASTEKGAQYPLLVEVASHYSDELKRMTLLVEKKPYAFDYMSDGSYISPTLRRAYAAVRSELPKDHDPFDSNGPVGQFSKKNGLIDRSTKRQYKYPGLKEKDQHPKAFLFIYLLLRMMLKVLGPNRFYDLSKLMVYLSIYRLNRKLWKL